MRDDSQNNDWIAERLRAGRPTHPAPPGFTERVMRRIEREENPVAERNSRFGLAFALALAVVAAIAAISLNPSNDLAQFDAGSAATSVQPEPLTLSIPQITPEQVQALTVKLDQPLEKELEYVISDTRQAIQFVAANFLPKK